MSDVNVLVVTTDEETEKTVLAPWADGEVYVCPSLTEGIQLLEEKEINVVAIDYNGNVENLTFALSDIRDLSPACALILFCDKQEVNDVTGSDISDSIFRIIPKPIATGQSQLAFKSAHKHHLGLQQKLQQGEDLSIDADNELPFSQLKYVFILFLIVFAGWLVYELFSDDDPDEPAVATTSEQTPNETDEDASTELDQLHQQASAALESDDLSRATSLFQQVLAQDAYDGEALSGLKVIASRWVNEIQQTINDDKQAEGLALLEQLRQLDPAAPALTELQAQLEALTQPKEQSETTPETPAQESLPQLAETKIRQAEETGRPIEQDDPILSQIDESLRIDADHLLTRGEAYRLLVAQAKSGELTSEYQERLDSLRARLGNHANRLVEEQRFSEAEIFSDALKPAGIFSGITTSLDNNVRRHKERQTPAQPQVFAAGAKIVPAIRISGPKPRYPRNAERRGIEGFVELEFTISASGSVEDVLVIRSEPEGVFEESATRALSRWRYQPRLVDDTPVSETKQIRMGFHL